MKLFSCICSLVFFIPLIVSGISFFPDEPPFSIADSSYRQVIKESARSMNYYLNYPQGSAEVQKSFENNGQELDKLDRFINQIFHDTLIYVESIRVSGYCSIEGSYDTNERLARSRAIGFMNYLDNSYHLSRRYPIDVNWVAEDWDNLREMVAASDMLYRDEVLSIMDNTDVFAGREKKLMYLRGGTPYRYMLTELFPKLRRVEITVNYDLHRIMEEKLNRKLSEEEFLLELDKERAAAEAEEKRLAEQARLAEEENARILAEQEARRQQELAAEAVREEARRQAEKAARLKAEQEAAEAAARLQRQENRKLYPLIGIKTDVIAWAGVLPDFKKAAFMPNLEAEVYFAGRWSVAATALYANWAYGNGKQFWGVSAYGAEPRFWFRNDGLFRGFHVGVYGEAGDFNNQKDRNDAVTTTTNYTGTFWSAGISAGYLLPLARHWSMEVSLRGGYRSAKYDIYDRELPFLYYSSSDKENKFMLTRFKLNIVYRFGKR